MTNSIAQYGAGPVSVLILTNDKEKLSMWAQNSTRQLLNIKIIVSWENDIEALKEFIKQKDRPFALIIDLKNPGETLGGDGLRWRDIIQESIGDVEAEKAQPLADNLSTWYSTNFELSTIRIGQGRRSGLEDAYKILLYLNGK